MDFLLILAGLWAGLMIVPLWVTGLSVLFIKQLSDDPENPEKPYFFTAVEPGRIKAVLRGGNVVRYLMNHPAHRFARVGEKKNDEFWNVEQGEYPSPFITPEPFSVVKYLFWPLHFNAVFTWYVAAVHRLTGHIFVGLFPFQALYIYRFTRKVQKTDANGNPMSDEHGLPVLVDKIESTDHVRVATFIWHVEGQAGETREGLKVQVTANANVRVTNPQRALFGSDRWDVVLTNTILKSLASIIRTMPVSEVLTSEETTRDKLAKSVRDIANEKLVAFGLHIEEYQILDFEGKLSADDALALTAKWRAELNREAERIAGEGRGESRAAEIAKVAEAIEAGGDAAKRAQELEALIRQAEAAGKSGGVVILGGHGTDPTLAAILAEMKKG